MSAYSCGFFGVGNWLGNNYRLEFRPIGFGFALIGAKKGRAEHGHNKQGNTGFPVQTD